MRTFRRSRTCDIRRVHVTYQMWNLREKNEHPTAVKSRTGGGGGIQRSSREATSKGTFTESLREQHCREMQLWRRGMQSKPRERSAAVLETRWKMRCSKREHDTWERTHYKNRNLTPSQCRPQECPQCRALGMKRINVWTSISTAWTLTPASHNFLIMWLTLDADLSKSGSVSFHQIPNG